MASSESKPAAVDPLQELLRTVAGRIEGGEGLRRARPARGAGGWSCEAGRACEAAPLAVDEGLAGRRAGAAALDLVEDEHAFTEGNGGLPGRLA